MLLDPRIHEARRPAPRSTRFSLPLPKLALTACLLTALGLSPVGPPPSAEAQTTDTALYRARFQATWSASSHPQSFPGNPHFSGLIGGVHSSAVSFWEDGGIASAGMEAMAEAGAKSPLDAEVQAAIDAGTALSILSGFGLGTSPAGTSLDFGVHRDYPLVTLVSMIAPSPDWFVGVSGLSLVESGEWVLQKRVTLYAWDAGTDSGTNYTSSNADTQPRQPIAPISTGPLGNGVPVGTFTFTRMDAVDPPPLLLQGGRFTVTAEWENRDGTRGVAMPEPLTADTGYFWFFDANNVEAVIKVLDACAINGHFWVFAGGLTDVEVELVVTDTLTDTTRTYTNDLDNPFQPIQETSAFATCP
ncbi:MAG: spondin domain-containing protein [Holophagales bacterium]|nr:spondin domain-containing protein [Holophagales bacterium]